MKIQRYAGIDIGSNGVRLLIMNIYSVNNKIRLNKTILVRAPIRLGSDSFVTNEIQEDSKEMLIEAMLSFKSLMKCYKVVKYRACATSAIREAINREEVLKEVKAKSGIDIEIIDGIEEADIIFSTQLAHLVEDGSSYLLIDVGGGSTEITYFKNQKIVKSQSFKIGTVRLLKNLVQKSEWSLLEEFITTLNIDKNTNAIGTGGNINTLFKYSKKPLGQHLSENYVRNFYNEIKNLTVDERIVKYDFNPDRADVIAPALEIYTKIMKWSNIHKIFVPKVGLADGLIRKLVYDTQ